MDSKKLLGKYSEYKRSHGRSGTVGMREAGRLKKNLQSASVKRRVRECDDDALLDKNSERRDEVDNEVFGGESGRKFESKGRVQRAMKRSPLFKALAENFVRFKRKIGGKPTLKEMTKLLDRYIKSKDRIEKLFEHKRNRGLGKPTLKEVMTLIERTTLKQSNKKPIREAKKPTKEDFKEYVERFKAYKQEKKGNSKLTEKELAGLKTKYLSKFKESKAGTFKQLIENYKDFKKTAKLKEKVSYREMKILKEEFRRKPKLKEANEGFAAVPSVNAADPNAVAAIQPGTENVNPEITAAVQGIKNQVDGLAQQVGLVNDDLSGDPETGIPPIDGAGAAPGADGQPVMEKAQDRATAIRERIATRAKTLKEEGELTGLTKAAHDSAAVGIPKLGGPNTDTGKSGETNASPYATIPSAAQLAKGKDGGKGATAGNTWPTKKDVPGEGKPLQGAGLKYDSKVEESVDDVTNRYVDQKLAPRLDYSVLTNMLKTGKLG